MKARRQHQRFDCELPVEIIHEERRIRAIVRNISAGGAFIEADEVWPFDTGIECILMLGKEAHTFPAFVRWQEDNGFGVQFGTLRALQMWALNKIIKSLGQ